VVKDVLEDMGYSVFSEVLNAKNFGVPQNRERIYIVCFKNKEDCDKFTFPDTINEKDKLPLNKFIEKEVNSKYYYTNSSGIWEKIKDEIKIPISKNVIYQYRRYYVRENKNNVCPTLTANMGTGGHNVPLIKDSKGIRKLTPRECFNLQGFPSDYKLPTMSDAGLYKLAGNAVSYPVVKKIADKIVKILDDIPVKKDTKELVIDDLPKEIKKKKKVKDVVV
jgi:DNA (cytosine-5)-methyltransferase 1